MLFPELELSSPTVPDWQSPELNLPQYDYAIPALPELKGTPVEYQYGELVAYGLPEIQLPELSSPELSLPGITLPSFCSPQIVGCLCDP